MMFNRILILIFVNIFLLFHSAVAQPGESYSNENDEYHSEIMDDPFIPNQYLNKKVTPAYGFSNTGLRNRGGTVILTSQVNVNANGMNIAGDAANEPSIAFNTFDRNHIVIGWRQFDNVSSNFRQAGWSYTLDAGKTWTFPGVIEPQVFRSDPVLDSDSEGNFYYNSLRNDFTCKIFKSNSNGVNWNQGIFIGGGDKQWMTIDKTGGNSQGNIYSSWSPAFSTCEPGFFTRSTDKGESFENCTPLPGNPTWGTMAVSGDGILYQAGRKINSDSIIMVKSLNAQFSGSTLTWESTSYIDLEGRVTGSTPINPVGLLGQVNIDIDRSESDGNVYVLASVKKEKDPADVMFVKSTDGGMNWSKALKINDDNSEKNYQWFGTMSVAPNGRIDVIWLDTRDASPGTFWSSLYYSCSNDQGNTWSPNEKLSESFDPQIGYPNQQKMGDYFDMKSDNTGAHLAWAATFNGEEDVYYSYIIPDIASSTENAFLHSDYHIFPVPSSGRVFIETNGEKIFAEIYSLTGHKIKSADLNENINEIDISSFQKGLYFLKLTDHNGKSITSKIIKE